MDVATERAGRPHQRPTQAYYIPPRRQQCGLPTNVVQNNKKEDTGPRERCTINPRAEGLRERGTPDRGRRNDNKQHDTQVHRSPNPQKSPESKVTVQATKQPVAKPKSKTSQTLELSRTSTENGITIESQNGEKTKELYLSQLRPEAFVFAKEQIKKVKSVTEGDRNKSSCRSQIASRPAVYNQDAPILQTPEKIDVCICDRPPTHLYCKRCSYECMGRISRVCLVHPARLALMDLRECPNNLCRSIQLVELLDVNHELEKSRKPDSPNETHLI